tara:strand:+ start:231 stop:1214 length:984 start_codon:yes stop_codon:yes gene_type:complete
MKEFVKSFPQHIMHALEISHDIRINIDSSKIDNIVIIGQGGSAIGGMIVKNLLKEKISIPILLNQDYQIPYFVNNRTLVIASSYSGNTEETLCALKEAHNRNSLIFCICSGGEMLSFSKKNSINYILIPSGSAPRAMLCYSIVQILSIISRTWVIYQNLKKDLLNTQQYLTDKQTDIIKLAKETAVSISHKMPFIYTFPEFEGVAIRFKQQLNENSKRHACYNLIPEMNHNEIVPWVNKNVCVIPIFLNGVTFYRNQTRMIISVDKIKDSVEDLIELKSNDQISYLQQYFYFIHLVDWISVIIAEQESVDPDDITLINYLKDQLKKL